MSRRSNFHFESIRIASEAARDARDKEGFWDCHAPTNLGKSSDLMYEMDLYGHLVEIPGLDVADEALIGSLLDFDDVAVSASTKTLVVCRHGNIIEVDGPTPQGGDIQCNCVLIEVSEENHDDLELVIPDPDIDVEAALNLRMRLRPIREVLAELDRRREEGVLAVDQYGNICRDEVELKEVCRIDAECFADQKTPADLQRQFHVQIRISMPSSAQTILTLRHLPLESGHVLH